MLRTRERIACYRVTAYSPARQRQYQACHADSVIWCLIAGAAVRVQGYAHRSMPVQRGRVQLSERDDCRAPEPGLEVVNVNSRRHWTQTLAPMLALWHATNRAPLFRIRLPAHSRTRYDFRRAYIGAYLVVLEDEVKATCMISVGIAELAAPIWYEDLVNGRCVS